MEGGVAEGYPHAWIGAQNGSGVGGCIGLPPGRYAAGFLFVSASERLANATICRFWGVFLSQMDTVLGGTTGYAPLLEGGRPGPLRELVFSAQRRVERASWDTDFRFKMLSQSAAVALG